MENFDLKKFLVENNLTPNSRLLKEEEDVDLEQAFHDAKINWGEEVAVAHVLKTEDRGGGRNRAESCENCIALDLTAEQAHGLRQLPSALRLIAARRLLRLL